jgi:hypothetical protein
MAWANVTMAQALFNNGVKSNNVTAQIFWLKARAGWVEAQPAGDDQDDQVTTIRIIGGLPECAGADHRAQAAGPTASLYLCASAGTCP